MSEQKQDDKKPENKLPAEDGTVMIYGFLQIKDAQTGQVLVNTRA
jgi:hypothetical protein